MKPHYKPLATALVATLQLAALAAVPLAWDVRPGHPAPVTFDRYHGETLEFRCTFRGFSPDGQTVFGQDADIRLWYQTNGMGQAWWSVPATVQSNVLSATWSPAIDPGADRVSLFFGAPSNAYAAAVLRLRHSPGFAPGTMPDPESFHESDPVFAAWLSTNALITVIADTARSATNYTDALETRLSLGVTKVMSAQYADSAYDSRRVYDEDAERSYTAPDLFLASTNAARATTKDALAAFSETGTVERARGYGTPTRWTDATGCVWQVEHCWILSGILTYTQSVGDAWVCSGGVNGYEADQYLGYWLRYNGNGVWESWTDLNESVFCSAERGATRLPFDNWGTYTQTIQTNLVGRVALTNDISGLEIRIAALEAQLEGLENALHQVNTGTNLVTNGGNQ